MTYETTSLIDTLDTSATLDDVPFLNVFFTLRRYANGREAYAVRDGVCTTLYPATEAGEDAAARHYVSVEEQAQ